MSKGRENNFSSSAHPRSGISSSGIKHDEILDRVPVKLIRRALMWLVVILTLLFLGSMFFTYPDVKYSKATLFSDSPRGMMARVPIPGPGAEKVKKGQLVFIRVNQFAFTEFGQLIGRIDSISLQTLRGCESPSYVGFVYLPEGIKTTYGKTLSLTPEMEGTVLILTEKSSLFQRFIKNFSSLLNS